jgi:hypothetical protein
MASKRINILGVSREANGLEQTVRSDLDTPRMSVHLLRLLFLKENVQIPGDAGKFGISKMVTHNSVAGRMPKNVGRGHREEAV